VKLLWPGSFFLAALWHVFCFVSGAKMCPVGYGSGQSNVLSCIFTLLPQMQPAMAMDKGRKNRKKLPDHANTSPTIGEAGRSKP